ncbi:MAG: hypothetical protein ABII00_11140 [Elusimicrobiota bacterium]
MKQKLTPVGIAILSACVAAAPNAQCAGVIAGQAASAGHTAPSVAVPTVPILKLDTLALSQAPSSLSSTLPGMTMMSYNAVPRTIQSPLAAPRAAAANEASAVPAAQAAPSRAPLAQARQGVLGTIKKFAAAIAGPSAARDGRMATHSRALFDGTLKRAAGEDAPTPVPAAAQSPAAVPGSALGRADQDGADLARLYPRVVFLLDVFNEPASDKTAQYVQSLVDHGVHVVFMTWRSQKGPGSAEEILLSRVKAGRTNPVTVVSHNGARIAPHSRAKNPAPVVEDAESFKTEQIETFRQINAKIREAMSLKEPLEELGLPDAENSFTYIVRLPASVPEDGVAAARGQLTRRYNQQLKAANLPFRVSAHSGDARAVIMHSTPLRFSLRRTFAALDQQFRDENLSDDPGKFLLLTDTKKSPEFSRAFPKQTQIQAIQDGGGAENILGAVLGNNKLQAVSVKLGKLRQYVEYWEPRHRYLPASEGAAPASGGSTMRGGDRLYSQKFAMFTGSVVYQLMAWFYEQVWRGQHKLTQLNQLETKLHYMWTKPLQNGVFVSQSLAKLMRTQTWKSMSPGYEKYARSFLRNFWFREFGNYSAAANDVMENMVGLATDRKSLITLNFASPATGRIYKIHTRIPRLMKLDTADGRVLTAHGYRSGKETPDDGEELFAKTLAMATLVGHGRKGPDGKWHHGSPDGKLISKLQVQLEYRSSHRSWVFNPEELLTLDENGQISQGPIVKEISSTIERMEADEEYQKHVAEQDRRATKEDLKPNKRKGA